MDDLETFSLQYGSVCRRDQLLLPAAEFVSVDKFLSFGKTIRYETPDWCEHQCLALRRVKGNEL